MNNTINLIKLDKNIKVLKYPIIFICRIISYKDEIGDDNLNMIIRLFFKYHCEILMNYNLDELFENEFDDFPITNKTITNFYLLINKKLLLVNILKKWFLEYNNPEFWNLELNSQISYLINRKEYFQSIFECSKVGLPFYTRILPILNNPLYRDELLYDIEKRLLLIVNIFDKNIFDLVHVKCITVSQFYSLSNEYIIRYLSVIYNKFIALLNNTIGLFQSYKVICDSIFSVMNPSFINIISEEISSETEIDDINLFCL